MVRGRDESRLKNMFLRVSCQNLFSLSSQHNIVSHACSEMMILKNTLQTQKIRSKLHRKEALPFLSNVIIPVSFYSMHLKGETLPLSKEAVCHQFIMKRMFCWEREEFRMETISRKSTMMPPSTIIENLFHCRIGPGLSVTHAPQLPQMRRQFRAHKYR